jgi:hypothetical protein
MRAEKRHMIKRAVDRCSDICEKEGYGAYNKRMSKRVFKELRNRLTENDLTHKDFMDFTEV